MMVKASLPNRPEPEQRHRDHIRPDVNMPDEPESRRNPGGSATIMVSASPPHASQAAGLAVAWSKKPDEPERRLPGRTPASEVDMPKEPESRRNPPPAMVVAAGSSKGRGGPCGKSRKEPCLDPRAAVG
jgi:hypothetical protein